MRPQRYTLSLILATSMTAAFGYVAGSSNLDFLGYPTFESKHMRPQKPYSKDEWSARQYRNEVETYQRHAREYLDAANNDVQRVQEEKQNAITSVNRVVDEYNTWVRTGY